MPFNASKPVPPTRHTGDAPAEGIAGDINQLAAAVAELQAASLLKVGDANGQQTFASLTAAQAAGAAGQIPPGTLVIVTS